MHLRQQCDNSRAAIISQRVERVEKGEVEDKRLDRYAGRVELPVLPQRGDKGLEYSETGFDGANGQVDGAHDVPSSPHPDPEDVESDVGPDADDDDWHSVSSFADLLAGTDLAVFPATWAGTVGRLVLHAHGVRFQRLGLRHLHTLWDVPYAEMGELRKFRSAAAAGRRGLSRARGGKHKVGKMRTSHALEIQREDGEVFRVEALRERDEAFNWIVGFSGVRWQNLQPRVRRV